MRDELTADFFRQRGWRVAVHNDYDQGGIPHTFWLFTHKEGHRYIKGEGETDHEALLRCRAMLERTDDA